MELSKLQLRIGLRRKGWVWEKTKGSGTRGGWCIQDRRTFSRDRVNLGLESLIMRSFGRMLDSGRRKGEREGLRIWRSGSTEGWRGEDKLRLELMVGRSYKTLESSSGHHKILALLLELWEQ